MEAGVRGWAGPSLGLGVVGENSREYIFRLLRTINHVPFQVLKEVKALGMKGI
jgi:hypothetical protein